MQTLYDTLKPNMAEFEQHIYNGVVFALTQMSQSQIRNMVSSLVSVVPGSNPVDD